MAVQTNYNETLSAAYPGQVANMELSNTISRNVETAAGLGFGVPVVQGSDDGGVRATQAGDTSLLGVTVRSRTVSPSSPNQYSQYDSAMVLTKGVIWVSSAGAVNAGDDVWVTVADGTFTNADAGGGATAQISGAKWDTSTTGAGLAKIRLG